MMTGVGEPAAAFLSPRSEGPRGDGDIPSTWNPTTCMTGTWALVPWSLRLLSMAGWLAGWLAGWQAPDQPGQPSEVDATLGTQGQRADRFVAMQQ
jgi:hypothetical protein